MWFWIITHQRTSNKLTNYWFMPLRSSCLYGHPPSERSSPVEGSAWSIACVGVASKKAREVSSHGNQGNSCFKLSEFRANREWSKSAWITRCKTFLAWLTMTHACSSSFTLFKDINNIVRKIFHSTTKGIHRSLERSREEHSFISVKSW